MLRASGCGLCPRPHWADSKIRNWKESIIFSSHVPRPNPKGTCRQDNYSSNTKRKWCLCLWKGIIMFDCEQSAHGLNSWYLMALQLSSIMHWKQGLEVCYCALMFESVKAIKLFVSVRNKRASVINKVWGIQSMTLEVYCTTITLERIHKPTPVPVVLLAIKGNHFLYSNPSFEV